MTLGQVYAISSVSYILFLLYSSLFEVESQTAYASLSCTHQFLSSIYIMYIQLVYYTGC